MFGGVQIKSHALKHAWTCPPVRCARCRSCSWKFARVTCTTLALLILLILILPRLEFSCDYILPLGVPQPWRSFHPYHRYRPPHIKVAWLPVALREISVFCFSRLISGTFTPRVVSMVVRLVVKNKNYVFAFFRTLTRKQDWLVHRHNGSHGRIWNPLSRLGLRKKLCRIRAPHIFWCFHGSHPVSPFHTPYCKANPLWSESPRDSHRAVMSRENHELPRAFLSWLYALPCCFAQPVKSTSKTMCLVDKKGINVHDRRPALFFLL